MIVLDFQIDQELFTDKTSRNKTNCDATFFCLCSLSSLSIGTNCIFVSVLYIVIVFYYLLYVTCYRIKYILLYNTVSTMGPMLLPIHTDS